MSSRTLNRKQFLVFTASAVATSVLAACGEDDPGTTGGVSGSGSGGTAGTGTAGSGTSGSASGSTTGGSAGSGTSGSATGGGGSGAGTGGSAAGTGGSAAGSGGASGGSGGGSGGAGGGGGGMCGTANITHTSDNQHDHIPADPAMLKMDLKTFINMAVADTTEFTVPSDGQNGGHVHKFKLSAQQITMLKGGGMVTGITTVADATNHMHTYTISCMA